MREETKVFVFFVSSILMGVCAVTLGVGWSNYLFTMRQKDCISAGYEWIHLPNYAEMECRKVTK